MESDVESLLVGVKAFVLLSIMPVVFYALWVDHFEKRIHDLMIKRPTFDREVEVEKVRFGGLLVILFQFTLFMGSEEIRKTYPEICELTLVLCVAIQLLFQTYTERKIKTSKQVSEKPFTLMARAARSWVIAGTLCGFTSVFSVQVAYFLAHSVFHVSSMLTLFMVVTGGLVGLGLGLLFNFGLAPYHILKILPTSALEDGSLKERLIELFRVQSVKLPRLWTIELDQLRVFDVLLAGFQGGRGIFAYSLFISRSAIQQLAEPELDALVRIQLSHLKLNHMRKRLLLASSLILNSTLVAILSALAFQSIFPNQEGSEFLGTTLGFLGFVVSLRWVAVQKHTQEFEADIYALDQLGVDFTDMATALRKLDFNSVKTTSVEHLKGLPLMGFPETERRIFILSAYLARQNGGSKVVKQDEGNDRAIA